MPPVLSRLAGKVFVRHRALPVRWGVRASVFTLHGVLPGLAGGGWRAVSRLADRRPSFLVIENQHSIIVQRKIENAGVILTSILFQNPAIDIVNVAEIMKRTIVKLLISQLSVFEYFGECFRQ